MYQNIITKEFINDNIRPFSGNDSLYNACVREAIQFDLGLPDEFTEILISDDLCEVEDLIDDSLRLSIGYFAYARAVRSGNVTITKYGVTTKQSENSFPCDSEKIVADSTYYKTAGEKTLAIYMRRHGSYIQQKFMTQNQGQVKDTYLKCNIIGE